MKTMGWLSAGLLLAALLGGCGGDVCEHEGTSYAKGESRWEPLCEGDTGMSNECTCLAGGDWACTDLGADCG